jgi:hypothetical protein
MNDPSSGLSDKDILEHAWKYFTIHASQRLLLFNIFMVSSAATVAGLAACLQQSPLFSALGVGLGGILVLNAFVFWKLDQRSAFLVKHAEDALVEIERGFQKPETRLVYREPLRTAGREQGFWLTRLWTYGAVFRFVFCIVAVAGILGAALNLARYLTWL